MNNNTRTVRPIFVVALLATLIVSLLTMAGCVPQGPIASEKVVPNVSKNVDGTTLEQDNIRAYRTEFSDPKSIKHLYVFNDQGDCIFYDSVRGKVTSGGKRLRPRTVVATPNQKMGAAYDGIPVTINGRSLRTGEVPSFDGTYGSSGQYIYWRNAAGMFRKLTLGAGMSTIVTSSPVRGIKAKVEIVTEVAGK